MQNFFVNTVLFSLRCHDYSIHFYISHKKRWVSRHSYFVLFKSSRGLFPTELHCAVVPKIKYLLILFLMCLCILVNIIQGDCDCFEFMVCGYLPRQVYMGENKSCTDAPENSSGLGLELAISAFKMRPLCQQTLPHRI